MTPVQTLWWEQVHAEHRILLHLRKAGAEACHQLHYLQMVTEKLGKAYFWRSGNPPRRSHASFVRFLQALAGRPMVDRNRIAQLLGFNRSDDFERRIQVTAPLAYELERLAPALAGDDGPNPEYPWPRLAPAETPVMFEFSVWFQLTNSGRGRRLLKVIDHAVEEFPNYA
jgi:hypothetical protein